MTDPRSPSRRVLHITAVLAAAVMIAVLAASCGSGGSSVPGATNLFAMGSPSPTAGPTAEPERTAEPTEEPTEEPSEEPTTEPTVEQTPAATAAPTPAGTSPGGDPGSGACGLEAPGDAGARLKDLNSYRTTIRLAGVGAGFPGGDEAGGTSIEAIVVRAPEPAIRMTIGGLGGETASAALTYILVGDRAWMDVGDTVIEMPADSAQGLLDTIESLSPESLYSNSVGDWTDGLERVGEETKNGVTAIHCRADAETAAALGKVFGGAQGAKWSMDVWVARDGGYLVSVLQKGQITSDSETTEYLVQIDVTDVNSPANKVEAPE